MAGVRFRDRLRYWFDITMSQGTRALIGWLALASVLLIVLVSGLVWLLDREDAVANHGLSGVLWRSLLRTLDPGTMGGDAGSPVYLVLMLTVTIGGIFIVSSLIGVLTTGLDNKITELRKGRSRIIERDHVVILGWSEQVFIVVSELAKANQSRRRSVVVILADHDKVAMEDQIRAHVGDTGRMRVACRSGNPLKPGDLELASPDTARSVIVLAPPSADPDIHVIKILLTLNGREWSGGRRPHVVAAIRDSANLPAAELAAGDTVDVIDADDIAVRLIVQSHRYPGLSTVCTELLGFDGSEVYMRSDPSLDGATYAEALDAYERGTVVGLRSADDGKVRLNPSMSTAITPGDEIILLAEDEKQVEPAGAPPEIDEDAIATAGPHPPEPCRTLIIGWNPRAPKIIDLLARLAEPGSVVDVAAPVLPPNGTIGKHANLSVTLKRCEPTSRESLEALGVRDYRHVVVLSDDRLGPHEADARTLVTLLQLRDLAGGPERPYSIVSEMNDDENREVAQVTRADDFIVSTKLITMLLTQLAENRYLIDVFTELYEPVGMEIYLKPAADYLAPGHTTNFSTLVESARRRGETAIGFRLHARHHEPPSYGVVLNPAKSSALTLTADDSVIVVAETNLPAPTTRLFRGALRFFRRGRRVDATGPAPAASAPAAASPSGPDSRRG